MREPLTWRCVECGELIDDGDGWITCDWLAAIEQHRENELRHAEELVEAQRSGEIRFVRWSELAQLPEPVPWRALHRRCDSNLDRNEYWFGVDRIRTWSELLDWNLHLSGKGWVEETNWCLYLVATQCQRREESSDA